MMLIAAVHAQTMGDVAVSTVSEDAGQWKVSFNWSEMDEYSKSVSHGDSVSGKVKISTDAIIMTSSADKSKVIKITIMKYSSKDPDLVNSSSQTKLAKDSLSKSGVCADITMKNQTACGHPTLKDGVCCGAARPHARFYGIQKSSSLRCPDPPDPHDWNSAFGFP
jgi:hypothetical protein